MVHTPFASPQLQINLLRLAVVDNEDKVDAQECLYIRLLYSVKLGVSGPSFMHRDKVGTPPTSPNNLYLLSPLTVGRLDYYHTFSIIIPVAFTEYCVAFYFLLLVRVLLMRLLCCSPPTYLSEALALGHFAGKLRVPVIDISSGEDRRGVVQLHHLRISDPCHSEEEWFPLLDTPIE